MIVSVNTRAVERLDNLFKILGRKPAQAVKKSN